MLFEKPLRIYKKSFPVYMIQKEAALSKRKKLPATTCELFVNDIFFFFLKITNSAAQCFFFLNCILVVFTPSAEVVCLKKKAF